MWLYNPHNFQKVGVKAVQISKELVYILIFFKLYDAFQQKMSSYYQVSHLIAVSFKSLLSYFGLSSQW